MLIGTRKHHYLPQGYLAAFTDTGKKDGLFYVLELDKGTWFRTSPKNVAAQRDFNRVDIEGHSPDVIEQAFSPVEALMIEACRRVVQTQAYPNDEDINYILNLLGLIAVRNPKLRTSFNKAREHMMNMISHMLVSKKEIFEHQVKKAREAGYLSQQNHSSYEDVKRFVEGGEYDIEFLPEGNLRIELETFDKILSVLGERIWSVFVAPPSGPTFICSDHPVTLVWKNERIDGPVGFGLKNTEVFFPLGPTVGLYGTYEQPQNEVVELSPTNVARLNRRIMDNAEKHVFSTTGSFYIRDESNIIEVPCILERR
ncbi:DUF4238 domain-containing protein [Geobacter argillaceus]|uniref:Uncharacterized protein DUF4238 n=1 Tax=Geobacter argillaceus TaxID=345631 RepID=A0A562VI77_9BACT|nr:DUF4238 domain-containing protein [Geobacter argillaceus]TWJ17538.1 uncharacterized protein DUF4238 [Geobacter argillaceus]